MYVCESATIRKAEQWRIGAFKLMLKKTLENPLDSKEIKPVYPKGNQHWTFIGSTGAKAPMLWPPDLKSRLIGKDADAGKDWGQEEKGVTEDEMVGCHYWLSGHEFEQIPADSEGQEAWNSAVHGVAKSQTLSDWTLLDISRNPRCYISINLT